MKPAATKATFADFRIVKSRKVAQLVFETPLELADDALRALGGLPQAAQERWCGIARLVDPDAAGGTPEPRADRRKFGDLAPATQAGMRCQEPAFWRFLNETNGAAGDGCLGGDNAAEIVRARCLVKSRGDLNTNAAALHRWHEIERQYQAWLACPV